jgi:two-component system sensor histidine kinase KdpD
VSHIIVRSLLAVAGVMILTFAIHSLFSVNATTAGFAYLLLVLVIASTWGFIEASLASVAATFALNFFFLPPVGTLTIADPENWVALFTFLATSLIAGRLSTKAESRAHEAVERQQDLERLYTFSRAILLIDHGEPFAKQLARQLVEAFDLSAALLYERRTGEIYRAGPSDFDGLDDQLRDAALQGASFSDAVRNRVITAVRLGSDPIASIALQGTRMPDSVLQGIANLVAIGLERARAQELAHEMEAARRSEELRTTLIDAMVHEFKTPLTAIKAATTSLLASPDQAPESRQELLTIADEEAERLKNFIDDAVEMARLDTGHIELHREISRLDEVVHEAITSMKTEIEDRPLDVRCESQLPIIDLDRRLVKLCIKQLIDNAVKYSTAGTPITIRMRSSNASVLFEIINHGADIPHEEQRLIFERFYRSPAIAQRIPGSGLGLSIAYNIVQAHSGDLTMTSHAGETTFRMTLPVDQEGEEK